MDLQQLLAAAQQMQDHLISAHQELADAEVEGTSGGGLVKARVNGEGELVDLTISPAAIDATDPAGRREIAVAEFAGCVEGADAVQLLIAVTRIVEAAWTDNPPATWEKAKRLLAEGHSRHEAIHRLAR